MSPQGANEPALSGPEAEIRRRIEEKGPVPFTEFMEVALYWPDGGYYTGRPVWGRSGDYVTSIDVSPAFARTFARQIDQMWRLLGSPRDFAVVEAGAGRGWLSKGIAEALRDLSPFLSDILKVVLVERNEALHEDAGGPFRWRSSLDEVAGIEAGCIISNELMDSFPVHRVVGREEGLREVYTGLADGRLVDVEGVPSTPEIAEYLGRLGVALEPAQRAEVNLEAASWIRKAASVISRGFVITVDYGYPAEELYRPQRPGTLLCHYRHTVNDDPYLNIGAQDITTHADFTALRRFGEEAGLGLSGFTTQKDFLLGCGILEEMREPPEGAAEEVTAEDFEVISHNRALAGLFAPGGMGDTFKVLIQHKGVDRPSLMGLGFRDLSAKLG